MSDEEEENTLRGWMKVIEESGKEERDRREAMKSTQLAFMRDLLANQKERTEGPIITWDGYKPSIRKDRVPLLLDNDRALLDVFQFMSYRKQWEENIADMYPDVFGGDDE